MRVNIYTEELTDRVELVSKKIGSITYWGIRFYLYLPVTLPDQKQISGPFIHHPGDDDSSSVTFWGRGQSRMVLKKALDLLGDE